MAPPSTDPTAPKAHKALTDEKLAKPESKWNSESHAALCGALADALAASGSSTTSHRQEIHSALLEKGFTFTWEAIR